MVFFLTNETAKLQCLSYELVEVMKSSIKHFASVQLLNLLGGIGIKVENYNEGSIIMVKFKVNVEVLHVMLSFVCKTLDDAMYEQ